MSYEKKEDNPRELTQEELTKIADEKAILLAQPGAEGSIWVEKIGQKGGKYHVAEGTEMRGKAINFYQTLLVATATGNTHLILEGHKFLNWSNGNVSRSPYNPNAKKFGGGKDWKPAPPKHLQELFIGDIDEINYKIENDKEHNWELPTTPILMDGRLLIVRYKPTIPNTPIAGATAV